MIALPPGTYQVTGWVTYFLGNEVITRRHFAASERPIKFDARPGRVTFIGKFRVTESREVRVH